MSDLHTEPAAAEAEAEAEASVVAVQDSLVAIESDHPITKNEVAFVHVGDERLKAEVLRVRGRSADLQVFEETHGIRVGDPVSLTGQQLSVTLGPGLLGQVFDGLQNPLETLARDHGFFLPRGQKVPVLDPAHKWPFEPRRRAGQTVQAGDVLGTVKEGRYDHAIMVPFQFKGSANIVWIHGGSVTVKDTVVRLRDGEGREHRLTLTQTWPVRRPILEPLERAGLAERRYPDRPLTTTIRLIDTFFPVALGGTGCIPGPFGAGKTVLQHLLSRFSAVDIVVIVACGERAGEVVEVIKEFPDLKDPQTGGALMDRTIIICNTSSMPVAAREASIYTGITLGEYYRQMGYDVLLLADSTSRWAQALRETSGRMEEIPGEEAFPAYLDSAIKGVYERAGAITTQDNRQGTLTVIGTVSPAGGNFEEPVTQSTLATVKTFLGLSYDRAYKRFYPAIDPLISWSRYLDQLAPYFAEHIDAEWSRDVAAMLALLRTGQQIHQLMQVTGEEGITLEDFVTLQKALLLDMVYLQQDAFDPVDVSAPMARQIESFHMVRDLVTAAYQFTDKEQARSVFTKLTGLFKNFNYAATETKNYDHFKGEIEALAQLHRV